MKIVILVLFGALIIGGPVSGFAQDVTTETAEAEGKFCPVCGPEEEMEALTFSYKFEGKKYSFCSLGCMKAFKKDPHKFLNGTRQKHGQ